VRSHDLIPKFEQALQAQEIQGLLQENHPSLIFTSLLQISLWGNGLVRQTHD